MMLLLMMPLLMRLLKTKAQKVEKRKMKSLEMMNVRPKFFSKMTLIGSILVSQSLFGICTHGSSQIC
jgi:hypothetical protein